MNQDTEWYGDRPPREQSLSVDNLAELQRDEVQHRLGPERQSQSDQNIPVASGLPQSAVYQRGRSDEPWGIPDWQPRSFAAQPASFARMEDTHLRRRSSTHSSERSSDREDSQSTSIVPNPPTTFQRGYYTSRDLERSTDRAAASLSLPSIARDQREAQSSGENLGRIGTGSPLDVVVYNPHMPPPPLELPLFDPSRPPPSFVPATRYHERNIFDALPPPPPPPPFDFDMTPQGDILGQPLLPQPQLLPTATITPVSQEAVIEIPDSPPPLSTPNVPSSDKPSEQDKPNVPPQVDPQSQPGPSQPQATTLPITRSNLKLGTFIDLTIDDEPSSSASGSASCPLDTIPGASQQPSPSRYQQPGPSIPQQSSPSRFQPPAPSRPIKPGWYGYDPSDPNRLQQPSWARLQKSGPSRPQQPGRNRLQQPGTSRPGSRTDRRPPASGIPPILPMSAFDMQGQQYPPVQQLGYMCPISRPMSPSEYTQWYYANMPPESYSPCPGPAWRGPNNQQRGDRRHYPHPPPSYSQWPIGPQQIVPPLLPQTAPPPPPPPPPLPPPPEVASSPTPQASSSLSDVVINVEVRDTEHDTSVGGYHYMDIPSWNRSPEDFYKAIARRFETRMVDALIYQDSTDFINGLNYLTELVRRNMTRFPMPADHTVQSGKMALIAHMCRLFEAITTNVVPRMGFEGAELIAYLNAMAELMALFLELCGSFFDDESYRQKYVDAVYVARCVARLLCNCMLNRLDYITYCIIKARPEYYMEYTAVFWTAIIRHFVFTVRYSRQHQVDIFRLYVLYQLFIDGINNEDRRRQARRRFRRIYGRDDDLRNNNRFIKRVAEKQDADPFYISRDLATQYLSWWLRKSKCPGVSALAGVCGIPPPTTTVDGWLPHSSVTPVDEDSDISITFWERFYTNEFYYGIQQTQWEIYQWERGINLMGARYRTAGDRELARIFTSDTSAQDERDQPGPSGLSQPGPSGISQPPNRSRQGRKSSSSSSSGPVEVITLSDSEDDNETPVRVDLEEPKTKDKRLARKTQSAGAASSSSTVESGQDREREVSTAATEVVESQQEQSIAEHQPIEVASVPVVSSGLSLELASAEVPKSDQTTPEAISTETTPMPTGQVVVTQNPEPAMRESLGVCPDLFEAFPEISITSILEGHDSDEELEQPADEQTTKETENAETIQTEFVDTTLEFEPSEKPSTTIEVPVEMDLQEGQRTESTEPNATSTSPIDTTISSTNAPSSSMETSTSTKEWESTSGAQEGQSVATPQLMETSTSPTEFEAASDVDTQSTTIEVPVEINIQEVASSETAKPTETSTSTTESKTNNDGEKLSTTTELPVDIDTQETESSGTTQPTETLTSPMKLETASDVENQSTTIEVPVEINVQEVASSDTAKPTETSTSTTESKTNNDAEKSSATTELRVDIDTQDIESSETTQPTKTSPLEYNIEYDKDPTSDAENANEDKPSEEKDNQQSQITQPTETLTSPLEYIIEFVKDPTSDGENATEGKPSAEEDNQQSQITQPTETSTSPVEYIIEFVKDPTSDVENATEGKSSEKEVPAEIDVQEVASSETTELPETSTSSGQSEASVDIDTQDIESSQITQPTDTSNSPMELEATSDIEKSFATIAPISIDLRQDESSQITQPMDISTYPFATITPIAADLQQDESSQITQPTETSTSPLELEATSDIEKSFATIRPIAIDLQQDESSQITQPMDTLTYPFATITPIAVDLPQDESSQITQPTETSISPLELEATSDIEKSFAAITPTNIDLEEDESLQIIQPTEILASPLEYSIKYVLEPTNAVENATEDKPFEKEVPVEIDVQEVVSSDTAEPPETSTSSAQSEASVDLDTQDTESSETTQPMETSSSPMKLEATSDIENQSTTIETPVEIDIQKVASSEAAEPTETSTSSTESETKSDEKKSSTSIEASLDIDTQETDSSETTQPTDTSTSLLEKSEDKPSEKEDNQQSTLSDIKTLEQETIELSLTDAQVTEIVEPHLTSAEETPESQLVADRQSIEHVASTSTTVGILSSESVKVKDTEPKFLEDSSAKPEQIISDDRQDEVSTSSKTSPSTTSDAELLWSSNNTTTTDCPDLLGFSLSSSSSGFKEGSLQQSEELPHEKIDEEPAQLEFPEEEPAKDESPKPAETTESTVDPISEQAASSFMTNLVEFLQLRRTDLNELAEFQSADEPETIVTSFQSLLELYFREADDRPTSFPTDLITILFEALSANCPEGGSSDLSDFIADLLDETKPEYNAAMIKLARLLPILEAKESTIARKPDTTIPETDQPSEVPKAPKKRGKLARSGNSSLDGTPQHTPRRKPRRKKKKISEASSVNEETLTITTTRGAVVPATIVAGQRRVKGRGKAITKPGPEVKVSILLKQSDTTTQPEEPTASTSTQFEEPTTSTATLSEEPTASTSTQLEEPTTSTATLSEEPTASTSRKRRSETRAEKKKKDNEKSLEEKRKKIESAAEENVEKDNCMTKVLQRPDGQSLCNEISVKQSCELFEEVTEIAVQPEELQLKIGKDEWNHQTDVKVETESDDFSIHSKSFTDDDKAETSDSSLSLAALPYEKLNKKKVQKYFNRKRRQFETTGTCSSEADSSAWSSLTASTSSLSSASSLSSDSFERSLNLRDPRLSGQSEVAKRYRQACEAKPAEGVAHEWRESFDDATVIYNENFAQEKSALMAAKQTRGRVSEVVASPKPTATSCLDFYNSFGREVSVDVVDETEVPHNGLINLASPNTEDETIIINLRHILNNLKQEPVEEEPNQVIAEGTVFLTPEWDFDQSNPTGYGNFNMPVTAASTSQPLAKNPHLIENLIAIQPEEVPPLQQQPAVVFRPMSNPPVNVVEKTIPETESLPTRTHAVSFFEQRVGEIYAKEFGQQDSALASRANTKKYSWRDAAVSSLGPYHRPKTPAPSKSKVMHVTAEDNELFQNTFEGPVVKPNRGYENEFSKLLWSSSGAKPLNGQVAATVKTQAAPIPDAPTKENLVSILKKSKSRGDNKRKRIQFGSPPLVDPSLNKLVDADCAHSVVQQPTELSLDYTFNNLAAVPINSNSQFISSNTNASQLYPAAVSAQLNTNNLLNYYPNYPVGNVMVQPQEVRRDAALISGGEEDIKEHFEEDYANTYTGYSRGGFIGDTFKGQPPESAVMIKDNPFIGGHLEESRSPIISTGTTSPMLEGAYLNSVNLYEASRKETEHIGALPENVALTLEKTLAQLPPKKRKLTEDQELAIYIQKFKEEKEQRPTQVVEEQISYPAQRQMSIAELHRDYPKTAIKTVAARKFYPSEPPNNPYFEYPQPYEQYADYGNKRSVMNVYINGVRECSANYPLCLMIGTMHTCVNNQPNPGPEAAQLPPEQMHLPQQPPVIPPVPEPPVVAPVKEPTRKRGRKPNPPQQGEPAPKRGRGRPRKNPIT